MDKKSDVKIIDNFIEFLYDHGKGESTIKLYTRLVREYTKWLATNGGSIETLTRLDIQAYINYLTNKGLSASTIENKMAAISSLAKFMANVNVLQNIRKPEHRKTHNIAPKSLEKKARNKVLREIERSNNLRNIAIAYLLLYTGLRVSELVALNRQDIIMSERSGTVIVKKGKGDVERKIPLPSEARLHIKKYLSGRKDPDKAVFLSNFKKRISIRSVQRIFEKYNIHPHQLRHTYCRELIRVGIDITTVADLAGHTDINVTRRYAKPTVIELEEAVEKAFT